MNIQTYTRLEPLAVNVYQRNQRYRYAKQPLRGAGNTVEAFLGGRIEDM